MRNKPTDIYAYAKQMAEHWMRNNKYTEHADVWDTYNKEDVNLYVEDNHLSITAYPLLNDVGDNLVIDTDNMYNVYSCPWYPKQRTNLIRRNK